MSDPNQPPTASDRAVAERIVSRIPINMLVAHDWEIDLSKHLCGCEVCTRSSELCPATQSSVALEIVEKVAQLLSNEHAREREVLQSVYQKLFDIRSLSGTFRRSEPHAINERYAADAIAQIATLLK